MDELLYHLEITKPKLIICHPDIYAITKEAAQKTGLSSDNIVFMEPPHKSSSLPASCRTVQELIADGIAKPTCYVERHLAPGEGKTKLASLSFSSGTTGRPKVRSMFFFPSADISLTHVVMTGCDGPSFFIYRQRRIDCTCIQNQPGLHFLGQTQVSCRRHYVRP